LANGGHLWFPQKIADIGAVARVDYRKEVYYECPALDGIVGPPSNGELEDALDELLHIDLLEVVHYYFYLGSSKSLDCFIIINSAGKYLRDNVFAQLSEYL
jgi:hypothetical protein